MMDENAAHEWLTWLYGENFEGSIWIGGHADGFRGALFTSVDDAVKYAAHLDSQGMHGVYHRLTTVGQIDAGRGLATDSVMLPALMMDLDIEGPGHKTAKLPRPRDFADVQRVLDAAGVPGPTTWVNSGGGLYPVWKLAEPIVFEGATGPAQEVSRALHRAVIEAGKTLGFKIDNTSDLARVYRLPGTMNRKVPGAHVPARWIQHGVEFGGYALSDFQCAPPMTSANSNAPLNAPPVHETSDEQAAPSLMGGMAGLFAAPAERHAPGDTRPFTVEQAMAFASPFLHALAAAADGEINVRLNDAACALAHFGPEFWDASAADVQLKRALGQTAYDGATWKAQDTIASARRAMAGDWRATLIPTDASQLSAAATAAGEVDPVDALLAEMITFEQVSEIPSPRYLIHGLLQFDSESWIIGAPGSKKSFVALDMAARVARGELSWQGRDVSPADVVMIIAEGAGGMGKRTAAWRKRFGDATGIHILPRPVQAARRIMGEMTINPEWQILALACGRLADAARERGRGLFVVIDTQARVTVGLNENAAEDMGQYIEAVRLIRQRTGGCVLSVHHTGRSGGDARGSSAIDGAQTTEIKIDSKPKTLMGRLIVEKQKDIEEIEPIRLGFEVIELGQDEKGRPINSLVLADQDSVAFKQAWSEALEGDGIGQSEAKLRDRVALDAWIEARRPERGQQPTNEWWIVQALVDTAETLGITQSDVKNIVEEKRGVIDKTTFKRAWQKVTDESGQWTDVVVKAGGERWTVDRVRIAEIERGAEGAPEVD